MLTSYLEEPLPGRYGTDGEFLCTAGDRLVLLPELLDLERICVQL